FGANPLRRNRPFIDDLDALQVRLERPAADPGNLAADAPQILRLAAATDLVAEHRFFAANATLHAQGTPSLSHSFALELITIAGESELTSEEGTGRATRLAALADRLVVPLQQNPL